MKQFIFLVLFSTFLNVYAQKTMTIHQKNGDMVSYSFAENPIMTYVGNNLHLTTTSVSIDYPLADLQKLTFSGKESSIGEFRVDGTEALIKVFRLDGSLHSVIEPQNGTAIFDTTDLPSGTYIIKQGAITTKLIKQ